MTQKRSILVVDDELGPRESLRMILKSSYDVHTASTGQEAIQFINQEKVDLVTLDLKMPGISGLDTLRAIKKLKNDIDVIVITGYATPANALEAIRHGARDFIAKPFNVHAIIESVNRSFERRSFYQKGKKPETTN